MCDLDAQDRILLAVLFNGKKGVNFQSGEKCIFASYFFICCLKLFFDVCFFKKKYF